MKCDELQYERLGEANWAYPASTLVIRKQFVDEAIAELKAENRELKRALWMARAERAVAAQSVHEWCRYNEKHPCGLWKADPFECWVQAWICVEKLCRKKAKEYK